MIPQTAAALIGFLFLVAPGIVFEMVRERRRPGLEQTAFREASRIALASLVFSVLALVILAALRTARPASMPDPGRWLQQPGRYLEVNYRLVAGFFLAELGLAIVLAALAARFLSRGQPPSIRQVSAWYAAFRAQRPTGVDVFVRVLLNDGMEYYGTVVGYTIDHQLADRELQLGSPLYRRLSHETTTSEVRLPWTRLIIPGTAIQVIWVSYLSASSPDTDGRIYPPASTKQADQSPPEISDREAPT